MPRNSSSNRPTRRRTASATVDQPTTTVQPTGQPLPALLQWPPPDDHQPHHQPHHQHRRTRSRCTRTTRNCRRSRWRRCRW
jgi:hypothetical protein